MISGAWFGHLSGGSVQSVQIQGKVQKNRIWWSCLMNLELVDEFVIFWFQKRTVCNGALLLLFKLDHFFWANTSCDCQKSWDGKFFLQNFDKHRHLNLYNRNLCLGRMTETALTQLFELVQGLADETIGLKGLEKLPDGGCQRSVPCQLSLKTYPLRSWQI